MKTLTTIAAAVLLCLSTSARAESTRRSSSPASSSQSSSSKLQLGIDASLGMPIGNYADVNGFGGGVLVTAEYPLMAELGATARIGFDYHTDKTVAAGLDAHVHSIPVLFGVKYYAMGAHDGLFAAAEMGLFDLMFSSTVGSSSEVKFGGGLGLGWQMKQWNARVNLHAQDFGSFGDTLMLSAGVGYQFGGF
ncbi:MAG TPA: hypothetical protein VMK66_08540 [Myxococcales bacterium]|nr:hypothetical protein [Myxococcales bacterium]